MTRAYYKAILQKLHRQKFYLHRWILSKHQIEFLNVSNDVPNWFNKCRNYKNHKGIVIQRLWVFEFRDPVLYFRDVSELRVPPTLRFGFCKFQILQTQSFHCSKSSHRFLVRDFFVMGQFLLKLSAIKVTVDSVYYHIYTRAKVVIDFTLFIIDFSFMICVNRYKSI